MCVYHLRWNEMCNALHACRHNLKKEGVLKHYDCNCEREIPKNAHDQRRCLACERGEGQEMGKLPCIEGRCSECNLISDKLKTKADGSNKVVKFSNLPKLNLCPHELHDVGKGEEALSVHYERFQKVEYALKNGKVRDRKDFVKCTVPISVLLDDMKEYWPKFICHHNDAKWQDKDWDAMKTRWETAM